MIFFRLSSILGLMLILTGLCVSAQEIKTLNVGDEMPDYAMVDVNDSIQKFSSFKGKYVFLDIWASWCFPCIKEYPFMAELEKKFENKNIVFVGLSCDDIKWRWQGAMGGYHIGGIQYLLKDKAFMKSLRVDRIPRYILLDPEGKIVEWEMSRPSDPKTEGILSKLNRI